MQDRKRDIICIFFYSKAEFAKDYSIFVMSIIGCFERDICDLLMMAKSSSVYSKTS